MCSSLEMEMVILCSDFSSLSLFLCKKEIPKNHHPKITGKKTHKKTKQNKNLTFPANSMRFPVMLKVVSQRLHERAHYSKSSSSNELFLV